MKKILLFFATISFSCVLWAQSKMQENLKWELWNNTLIISGSGNIPNYMNGSHIINNTAPWYNEQIERVVIKEGITNIGDGAFANYWNLTSVFVPPNINHIGEYAFMSCNRLTSIFIPRGITKIEKLTFYGCEQLASFIIPNGVIENIQLSVIDALNIELGIIFSFLFLIKKRAIYLCLLIIVVLLQVFNYFCIP